MIDRVCEVCGVDFKAWKSKVAKGKGKYCSPECVKKAHREKYHVTEKGRMCATCEEDKDWGYFNKWARGVNGYDGECKACANKKIAEIHQRNTDYWKDKDPYADPSLKRCTKCKKEKERKYFRRHHTKDGLYGWCAECHGEKGRERKYGVTKEFRDAMLVYQQGRCWFCPLKENGKKLHIDHNHAYEKGDIRGVRGLLCSECNKTILHWFENNQEHRIRMFSESFKKHVENYLKNPPAQKFLREKFPELYEKYSP